MNKKSLLILFIVFIVVVMVGLRFCRQVGKDTYNDIAVQLSECLPKSDMVSKEKCDELLKQITDFDSCVSAGFSIMKSNPPQCQTPGGKTFTK